MEIRGVRPEEYERVGNLLVDAFGSIPGLVLDPSYVAELTDIAGRSLESEVLVAVVDEAIVGTITYVPTSTAADAEFDDPEGAGIRMLGVSRQARRGGIGRALTRACIERAVADGRAAVYLHTTELMVAAMAMYESMGFVHDLALDWDPIPEAHLLGYRLPLNMAKTERLAAS